MTDTENAAKQAWIRLNSRPSDFVPKTEDEFIDDLFLRPFDDDELDRIARWRNASNEQRGRALAELLDFVDAVGRFPPKPPLVVVFPRKKRTTPTATDASG